MRAPTCNAAPLALLPLVGVAWRSEGEGRGPHGDYRFSQQIIVSHDGGDYLNWEARSWRLNGRTVDTRRTVFVKPASGDSSATPTIPPESQAIELLLAHSAGYVELFYGRPLTQSSWELVTDALARSTSGCSSAGQAALRESSKAATSDTSRNASTPTAGWCRTCRPGCPGSSADRPNRFHRAIRTEGNPMTWGGPEPLVPGWTNRGTRGRWLLEFAWRAQVIPRLEPPADSHLTCP